MQHRQINKNYYIVENKETNFSADIRMNPRDAMVFASVCNLSPTDQEKTLSDFETYLKDNFGAKMLLQLPSGIPQTHGEAKDMPAVKFITPHNIQQACSVFANKEKLAQLKQPNNAISFLTKPEQFNGLYEKLFAFKKANAESFVTEAKIKNGLYSATAEKEKIANDFARHFALYDKQKNEFIACIQLCVHGNLGYLSDLIVSKDARNLGYAQLLLHKALIELSVMVDADDHQQVAGAWLIEGAHDEGDPLIPVHHRLYDELLGAKPMTAALQRELGLRLIFGPAKELLLTAANRDLKTQESLDSKLTPNEKFENAVQALRTRGFSFSGPHEVKAGEDSVVMTIRPSGQQ